MSEGGVVVSGVVGRREIGRIDGVGCDACGNSDFSGSRDFETVRVVAGGCKCQ